MTVLSCNHSLMNVWGAKAIYCVCLAEDCQHSASCPQKSFISVTFSPAHHCFFMTMQCCGSFGGCWRCSLHTLWIYVLFPDAEESTELNDEQAASASVPIKKLIVCPSWRGNEPLGFSRTSLTTQIRRLLTPVCMRSAASCQFSFAWSQCISSADGLPQLGLLFPK